MTVTLLSADADAPDREWRTLRSEVVYDNPWISVRHEQVVAPSGASGIYGVIHRKSLGILVLPIDGRGRVTLIGQHRHPIGRYSWELPSGGSDPGEAPAVTARRELAEETGLLARHVIELFRCDDATGFTDGRTLGFLAWGLEEGEPRPDGTEVLDVRRVPFRVALDLACNGGISHAQSQIALLKARLMAVRGELPEELAALILAEAA
ncbi:NUDIX domain-containing protein [Arenibaculum pallidiluteum]|uniref:NUDIX domain-containing protein n=1 Tax=Arenibaculum pallidiluteum TaxID=2812559 RepID=UPI001A97321C|nr:NUDIX hydrolase [Arenibaculum pallidiluteum]